MSRRHPAAGRLLARRTRTWLALLALAAAGCTSPSEDLDLPDDAAAQIVRVDTTASMTFEQRVVTTAMDLMGDVLRPTGNLYEPHVKVSDTGAVYLAGHVALTVSTGAPAYVSHDDGVTWSQLPFPGPVEPPSPLQGATPPPSNEIFLVTGDDGWVYGVDMTLATYPVNAWSGDGTFHAYYNADAYDKKQVVVQQSACEAFPLIDRPWAAYANGTLLMVNNPAAGPAQIGVLPVPPVAPAAMGTTTGGAWNLCAGPGHARGDCSVPGLPGLRDDGLFAVPQACDGRVHVIVGNAADVMEVRRVDVLPFKLNMEYSSKFPHAGFDREGTLFVAFTNNTGEGDDMVGHFNVAASTDGATFQVRTFHVGGPIRNFWMDANRYGPGAIVVWAVDGDSLYDWYVGHLHADDGGVPFIENVALAIDEGPFPELDFVGSTVGPDGRAYLAQYVFGPLGGMPLSVYVQTEGPVLGAPALASSA